MTDTPPAVVVPMIDADRPGIGSDPQVIPQFTLQPEMGTDGREIRLGVIDNAEFDRDEKDWAVKYAITTDKLISSLRLSYGHDLAVEVPANIHFGRYFNLGLDVQWQRNTPMTYAAEFNITPTNRLTVTPTLYRDNKTRAAIFFAWIPPGHNNIQLDAGYDNPKITVGISTAISFAKELNK